MCMYFYVLKFIGPQWYLRGWPKYVWGGCVFVLCGKPPPKNRSGRGHTKIVIMII